MTSQIVGAFAPNMHTHAYTVEPRLAEILALSNWVSHPMNLAFLNIRAYIANGFDRNISGIHKFEKNRLCS